MGFKHKKTTTIEAAQMNSYTVNIAFGLDIGIDANDKLKDIISKAEKDVAKALLIMEKFKKINPPQMKECDGKCIRIIIIKYEITMFFRRRMWFRC